jgi:hypothetical protein
MEFLTVPQLPVMRDVTDEEHQMCQRAAIAFFDTDLRDGTHSHEDVHQWYLDQVGGDEDLAMYAATMMVMSVLCVDYGMTREEAMQAVGVRFVEETGSYQGGE